ncbi:MAG TPA: hypothetical protein VIE65_22430 [Methylobacter sp.]|jgi:hypothetical protein
MKSILCTAHPGIFVPWPQLPAHIRKTVPHLAPKTCVTCDAAKPKIDPLFLTLAHAAVESMSRRMDHVEQHFARQKDLTEQGLSPAVIVANAAAKAAQLSAELYRDKIDNVVAEHREKKADQAYRMAHGDPSEPRQSDPPVDDRQKHMRLDSSSGSNAQKSETHPTGDASNFMTLEQVKAAFAARKAERDAEQAAFMREARQNKNFNDNQHALVKSMRDQIAEGVRQRWG